MSTCTIGHPVSGLSIAVWELATKLAASLKGIDGYTDYNKNLGWTLTLTVLVKVIAAQETLVMKQFSTLRVKCWHVFYGYLSESLLIHKNKASIFKVNLSVNCMDVL